MGEAAALRGGLLAWTGTTCDVDHCGHGAIITDTTGNRACGVPHLRQLADARGDPADE